MTHAQLQDPETYLEIILRTLFWGSKFMSRDVQFLWPDVATCDTWGGSIALSGVRFSSSVRTMFKPSPALPERQSKEDAAIAMETARPIMWFGEDGQEVRLGGWT